MHLCYRTQTTVACEVYDSIGITRSDRLQKI